MQHIVKTGGGGAGVVCEDSEVRFLEARVTIAGRVVSFGVPAFESVGPVPEDGQGAKRGA